VSMLAAALRSQAEVEELQASKQRLEAEVQR
jgi:hypothetical protein